jgi:hypothetical protein
MPTTGHVTAASLNLRDGPNGDKLGDSIAIAGDALQVLNDAGDGWPLVRVTIKGAPTVGFVDARFIALDAPAGLAESESHRGDPDGDSETLTTTSQQQPASLNAAALGAAATQPVAGAAGGNQRRQTDRLFAQQLLKIAAAEIGVSRTSNPARVTEYLNLFKFSLRYPNGVYVPFCAAGVGWAVCKAYCDLPPLAADSYTPIAYDAASELKALQSVFFAVNAQYCPLSASVPNIVQAARATHSWAPASATPLPGWLVIYNWDGGQSPEHIGIVESASANTLIAIEFNTRIDSGPGQGDGGAVARKDRQRVRKDVLGFVMTY